MADRLNLEKYVPELDGIRGVACIFILIAHCITGPAQGANNAAALIYGHTIHLLLGGVDLFFVLSGFLIGGILLDSKNSPHFFKGFYLRRAARILPVAYLLLATYAIALYVQQHFDIGWMTISLLAEPRPPVWSFATFLQSYFLAVGGYGGPLWMGITWSLAIEEQFYLLFPLAVYFLPRRSVWMIAVAGICISPVLRDVFERLFGNWYASYVLMPSRCDSLMFGVLVALIVRDDVALAMAKKVRWQLDGVALYLLYQITFDGSLMHIWESPLGGRFPPLKQTFLGLMFAIVILRIFLYRDTPLERLFRAPILAQAGALSYAIYMYHQAVNGLLHGYLFGRAPTIDSFSSLLLGLVVIAISVWLAKLSYRYLEMPIRRRAAVVASRMESEPVLTGIRSHPFMGSVGEPPRTLSSPPPSREPA